MMNTSHLTPGSDLSHQLYCQYSANQLLPVIDWAHLLSQNTLLSKHVLALETIYQATVPLALTALQRLGIDVCAPKEDRPPELNTLTKLRALEPKLLAQLAQAVAPFGHDVRHAIWSMLLRGAPILVFKAWLGKVKTGEDVIDLSYFGELASLLWLEIDPYRLAAQLDVSTQYPDEPLVLLYQDRVLLNRFNTLATAELFARLGMYDPVFLAMRDDKVCQHFIQEGLISQGQIDDLLDSMDPLFADSPQSQQRVVQFYH